jgi:hypothetical protein
MGQQRMGMTVHSFIWRRVRMRFDLCSDEHRLHLVKGRDSVLLARGEELPDGVRMRRLRILVRGRRRKGFYELPSRAFSPLRSSAPTMPASFRPPM